MSDDLRFTSYPIDPEERKRTSELFDEIDAASVLVIMTAIDEGKTEVRKLSSVDRTEIPARVQAMLLREIADRLDGGSSNNTKGDNDNA